MRVCILCIGNRDGGDDAIGPYIADHLTSTDTRKVIDAETVPENFTGVIKQFNPDQLVIIDAVDMGLQPGEIRIIPKEKLGAMHISTHGIPLSVMISYLQQYIPKIMFIGIQPKTMNGSMKTKIVNAGKSLINMIETQQLSRIETL